MPTEQPNGTTEFEALQRVIAALQRVDRDAQQRIVEAASTFLQLESVRDAVVHAPRQAAAMGGGARVGQESRGYPAFGSDHSMTPKEFLLLKQPRTDVERIAVLAYYLTHYRDTPHFKTLDLSKLNTEAAQPKFSNAAYAANNAVKTRYLVPASKGYRQLSAPGERFVDALPDRDAARQAMAAARPRRRARRASAKATSGVGDRAE